MNNNFCKKYCLGPNLYKFMNWNVHNGLDLEDINFDLVQGHCTCLELDNRQQLCENLYKILVKESKCYGSNTNFTIYTL